MFQHTYVCPSKKCLDSNNPHNGSWHQRAVNLPTATPRADVACPGCGTAMIIGADGGPETYETDKQSNLVRIGGNPSIFEKTDAEAPDQSGDASIFIQEKA